MRPFPFHTHAFASHYSCLRRRQFGLLRGALSHPGRETSADVVSPLMQLRQNMVEFECIGSSRTSLQKIQARLKNQLEVDKHAYNEC